MRAAIGQWATGGHDHSLEEITRAAEAQRRWTSPGSTGKPAGAADRHRARAPGPSGVQALSRVRRFHRTGSPAGAPVRAPMPALGGSTGAKGVAGDRPSTGVGLGASRRSPAELTRRPSRADQVVLSHARDVSLTRTSLTLPSIVGREGSRPAMCGKSGTIRVGQDLAIRPGELIADPRDPDGHADGERRLVDARVGHAHPDRGAGSKGERRGQGAVPVAGGADSGASHAGEASADDPRTAPRGRRDPCPKARPRGRVRDWRRKAARSPTNWMGCSRTSTTSWGGECRSVRQGLPPAGGPVADSRPRELPSVEAPRSSRSVGPAARPVTVREVACSPVTGLIDPPPLLGRGDGSGRCCLRRGVQQTREGRPDDAHARSGETLS